jgi:hypothetical protein
MEVTKKCVDMYDDVQRKQQEDLQAFKRPN